MEGLSPGTQGRKQLSCCPPQSQNMSQWPMLPRRQYECACSWGRYCAPYWTQCSYIVTTNQPMQYPRTINSTLAWSISTYIIISYVRWSPGTYWKSVRYCPTQHMVADIFTKAPPVKNFEQLRMLLSIYIDWRGVLLFVKQAHICSCHDDWAGAKGLGVGRGGYTCMLII